MSSRHSWPQPADQGRAVLGFQGLLGTCPGVAKPVPAAVLAAEFQEKLTPKGVEASVNFW